MGACSSSKAGGQPGPRAERRANLAGSNVRRPTPNILDHYSFDEARLGEGTFGVVFRGVHRATGDVRAVKSIPLDKANGSHLMRAVNFRREVSIMKGLDHDNIVRMYEAFADSDTLHLVTELCRGGELFDRIVGLGHFSERQAATVMHDLMRAVGYLHESGIAHRDLKPENCLFASQRPVEQNVLKVIDFGCARRCTSTTIMTTVVGTRFYVAPQVLRKRYCRKCDIWSCGAILYTLLSGKPAFVGRNDKEVLAKVRAGQYSFEGREWLAASQDAKRLIRMMMHLNPRARYSAQQAVEHLWIRKNRAQQDPAGESPPPTPSWPATPTTIDSPRGLHRQNRLMKAALQAIASQLKEREAACCPPPGGGASSAAESDSLKSTRESRLSTASGDEDVSPDLDCPEDRTSSESIDFHRVDSYETDEGHHHFSEEELRLAFEGFDEEGSGRVAAWELCVALAGYTARGPAEEYVRQWCGGDDEGALGFEEFKGMLLSCTNLTKQARAASCDDAEPLRPRTQTKTLAHQPHTAAGGARTVSPMSDVESTCSGSITVPSLGTSSGGNDSSFLSGIRADRAHPVSSAPFRSA